MLFIYSGFLICILNFFFELSIYYLFPITIIIFFLTKFLLSSFFDITIATALDASVSIEIPQNSSYIVSCCTIDEKINVVAVMKQIKERAFIHPYYEKLKKIYCNKFGIYYWKKVKNFNIDDHIEVLNNVFPDYDSLYKFMGSHVSDIKFEKTKPNWKIFIVANFLNNQSALIMKIHHGISDGLSLMNYLLILGDTKEYQLLHIPKIKYWQWIFIYLMGFLDMLKFIKKIFTKKIDNNCFKENALTGKKNCYCTPTMDLKIIKTYAKTLGVSINDILMGLLAKTLRNYHNRKFNKDLKEFSLMIAASLIPMPKKGDINPLCNNVNILSENLYFDEPHDTFSHYIKQCHLVFKHMKSSYSIYYQHLCAELNYLFFPMKTMQYNLELLTNSHTAAYTSVPGPTTPISIFGYDVKELFFFCFISW